MLMWSVDSLNLMLRQTSSAMVQPTANMKASTRFTAARDAGGRILYHTIQNTEFRYETGPPAVPTRKNARCMITLVKLLSVGETSFISISPACLYVYMHKTGITCVHGHNNITTNTILAHSCVCVGGGGHQTDCNAESLCQPVFLPVCRHFISILIQCELAVDALLDVKNQRTRFTFCLLVSL